MKHMIDAKALCPYYKHENPSVIYCDGVQDGSVLHLAFSTRAGAKEYKQSYCRKCYTKCKIYKLLDSINLGPD